MLPNRYLNVFTDTAYPVGRQDRHFYFRLLFFEEFFSLSRKTSNTMSILPKHISKANISKKIEMISKAVISATVYASLRSLLNRCHRHLATLLCIPASRFHKLGRLPLRFASVGADQASPGRLAPCHGHFPYIYYTKHPFDYQDIFIF